MDKIEVMARAVAEQILRPFDECFQNKAEWVDALGEKDGVFHDINEPFKDEYLAAAQAALSALQEAGYVVVPVEPTEAMLDAFVARALQVSIHGEGGWSNYGREQYKTMLSAAQKESE